MLFKLDMKYGYDYLFAWVRGVMAGTLPPFFSFPFFSFPLYLPSFLTLYPLLLVGHEPRDCYLKLLLLSTEIMTELQNSCNYLKLVSD